MAEITAALVKALRDKTDAGMMDCKKALNECNGDMDAAVKYLREKGIAKAAAKADRDAKEGVIRAAVAPCAAAPASSLNSTVKRTSAPRETSSRGW